MFERNLITELEQWVAKTNRKPLILRGSRQVGKTTLVDNFSGSFENYLYLNFEKSPSAVMLFEKEQEIVDLVAEIFLFCNKENKRSYTPSKSADHNTFLIILIYPDKNFGGVSFR